MPQLSDAQLALRKKQTNEVLNVWNDVQRQVFTRERVQAANFDTGVQPQKSRDLESEVNSSTLIENLNKLMESKTLSLENLLARYEEKNFANVVLVSDIINLFNSILRIYVSPNLSRTSRELIKVKLQDLEPNAKALSYGVNEMINILFEKAPDKRIYNLVRALTVYNVIRKELETNNYYLIDKSTLDAEFRNILSQQSQERRNFLASLSEREPADAPLYGRLKQYPVFDSNVNQRIAQVQEELGVDLTDDLRQNLDRLPDNEAISEADRLVGYTKEQLPAARDSIKASRAELEGLNHQFEEEQERYQALGRRLRFVLERKANVDREVRNKSDYIQRQNLQLRRLESQLNDENAPLGPIRKQMLFITRFKVKLTEDLAKLIELQAEGEGVAEDVQQKLYESQERISQLSNYISDMESNIRNSQRELADVFEVKGKPQKLGKGMNKVTKRGMGSMVNSYRETEHVDKEKHKEVLADDKDNTKKRAKHVPIRFNQEANSVYS
jgi:hypothetical protein